MIGLNDFRRQWSDTGEAAMQAFRRVGESGWYILGQEVRLLEAGLAACWRLPYAVGVASGLDAIEISLRILGCGPGDKVLTTPLSAFATTLAILKLGATPVFVDTDEFGLIDLEACRDVLRQRPDIRFLIPVHLYGNALNLSEMEALGRDFGCLIVEDCAQSILASAGGRPAGSVGHLAATSFYPTKNLGALGDGGAILTAREEFYDAARCLRDYGQSAKYRHDRVGYNSRLDELQAAVMRDAYLPKLAAWTARRRHIAARYMEHLRGASVVPLGQPAWSDSVWHLFPVRIAGGRKQELLKFLEANGVAAGEHYPVAIPDQRALEGAPHEIAVDCTRARELARSEVSLPIHPYLNDGEVDQVIDACLRWEAECCR